MENIIFQDIKEKLHTLFNLQVVSFQEIQAGSNNKLIRIETNEKPLLAKIYHQDDRQRLHREFQAISFFNKKKLTHTPKALLKNDVLQYGIYSYEKGDIKNAKDLIPKDIKSMSHFIATLHNIQLQQVKEEFLPAILACFSLQDYIDNTMYRLGKFNQYISDREVNPKVLLFAKQHSINEHIDKLIAQSIENISREEITSALPIELRRLSPVDFGPHNMLFKPDGDITFVDFEYFGWDDPARLIGDFMNHDQTNDISAQNKQLFINVYKKNVKLSHQALNRIDIAIRLIAIEWLAIILYSLTPEKLKVRQFADKDFNLDNYIEKQISKFNTRLQKFEVKL